MEMENVVVEEVKEEEEEEESPTIIMPRPMAGLNDAAPPPFLTKTYEMVEDPDTDSVVSWSAARNSFVVWDSHKLATTLLPKYFKHGNISSFIRQLNTYEIRWMCVVLQCNCCHIDIRLLRASRRLIQTSGSSQMSAS